MDEQNKPQNAPVTEGSPPQRLAKGGGGGKKAGIIAGSILVLLVAAYMGVCAMASSSNVILPNSTIAGIPVGNMDMDTMMTALDSAKDAWQDRDTTGIIVQVDGDAGQQVLVKVPASYASIDWTASAQKVWDEGRGNGAHFLQKGALYLSCLMGGQEIAPVYMDNGQLDEFLEKEVDEVLGQVVVDHSYAVEENELILTRGQPGRGINKELVKEEVFSQLADGRAVDLETGAPSVTATLVETLPEDLDWQTVVSEVCSEPQDAVFDEATGDFQMEKVGVSFDEAQAQNSFNTLGWGESCTVPLVLTEPKVKFTDLEELLFRDTLGACSTNIGGSSNRLANVKLAASFCNELVLAPGEEFSYNGTVGRRTSARGFLPAPAYVAGETVDEIGGGICQVSSTIYLASLRSNLAIVERHNHGYTVGYVPNGLDATVYYGSLDFRFKNDTEFPIKIVATVSERTLNVQILGTKTSEWSVEMKTEQYSNSGYNTVYKVDDSVAVGSTKTKVTPYSGCTVDAYRCIYDANGELVSRTHESTSRYKSRDKVILVNSADAYKYGIGEAPASSVVDPVETPDPAPTPTPTDPVTPAEPVPEPTPEPTPDPAPTPAEPIPETTPAVTPEAEPAPAPTEPAAS